MQQAMHAASNVHMLQEDSSEATAAVAANAADQAFCCCCSQHACRSTTTQGCLCVCHCSTFVRCVWPAHGPPPEGPPFFTLHHTCSNAWNSAGPSTPSSLESKSCHRSLWGTFTPLCCLLPPPVLGPGGGADIRLVSLLLPLLDGPCTCMCGASSTMLTINTTASTNRPCTGDGRGGYGVSKVSHHATKDTQPRCKMHM